MQNSHLKRILTALALVPVLAFVVFANNRFLLSAFFLLISILAMLEYYSFFWKDKEKIVFKFSSALLAGIMFSLAIFKDPNFLLLGSLLAFWSSLLLYLYLFGKDPESNSWVDTQIQLSGLIYIPFALQLIIFLPPKAIILVLLATAGSDIGAFYTGKYLGKKKVWPAVSPKKTWMGCFGGFVACILVSLAWGVPLSSLNWWHWLWIALIINLAAQIGDFFQSALKRHCCIKDSGKLLPGHGGILDRIDSLLLSLPVYFGLHVVLSPF